MYSPQRIDNTNFFYQWVILISALLTLGSLIAYNQFKEYRQIDSQERRRLSAQTEIIEKNVVAQLVLTNNLIDSIIFNLPSWQADKEGNKHTNHLLKIIDDASIGISPILVINTAGKVVASSNKKLVGMNFAYREYFKTALKNPDPKILHVSAPYKTVLDTYVISLFRTIPGPHGEFAGIVIVSAVPEYFTTLLDSVRYAPDMWTAIVHGDGKLFMISPDKPEVPGKNLAKPGTLFSRHLESGKISNVFAGSVYATGENRIAAFRSIHLKTPPTDKPLVVAVTRDLATLFSPWQKNTYLQSLLFGVLTVISTLGLYIIQRRQRDLHSARNENLVALNYAKECFQQALNRPQHILYRLNVKKGCYDYMSPVFERITGHPLALFMHTSLEKLADYFHPDDRERIFGLINKELSQQTSKTFHLDVEYRFRRADGSYCWLYDSTTACLDDQGALDCFFGSAHDITERKQIEDALQEREYELEEAQLSAGTGSWTYEPVSHKITWSKGMLHILGLDPALGMVSVEDHRKYIHPEDYPRFAAAFEAAVEHGVPYTMELRINRPDGSQRTIVAICESQCDATGKVVKLRGANQDITERKQQEETIRKSEQDFRMLAESMPQIVWASSAQGNNIYVNQQWVDYTGLTPEESCGHGWNKPFHPEDQQKAWDVWQNASKYGAAYELECRLRRADGIYKWWLNRGVPVRDESGTVIKWFGTCTDIDDLKKAEEERRALEQQLIFAQKMESLGVLSGGIAHDFNNILAIIIGHCSLADMNYEKAGDHIPAIEKAANRAAALCRQMLAYAGKTQILQSHVNLVILVDEMVKMLKATINQNAVIQFEKSTDIPIVLGDASQIRQVVMNLIINASEAIDETHGEIRVLLSQITISADQQVKDHQDKPIPAASYACLEVTDNGCGMDSDTRKRIFEPFYTTKFTGRGLGMSAVLGIIMSHGGTLQLISQLGQGSTFKVYLPIPTSETVEDGATQQVTAVPCQGSGTVLLVEDEEQVKSIANDMLTSLGFAVIEASNGKEALELFQENFADITLVLTDMGMPVMNGYELFHELKKLKSGLPIVISSGFGDVDVTSKIACAEIAGMLNKPYSFDQLQKVLKSVMEHVH